MVKRQRPSFILIPGAGGMAWYWHRVVPLLAEAGHEAIAVDLPADDERSGLKAYTDIVISAIGKRPNVILVGQSLGGFTVPLASAHSSVRALIFVNAMIPQPGETAGAWWENTGAVAARNAAAKTGGYGTPFDINTYFLHDVPASVLGAGPQAQREQSQTVFAEPCDFTGWPSIPTRVIAGADDRFFPLEFQRQVARERLNAPLDVLPGGHLVALSRPVELVDLLLKPQNQALRSAV